MSVAEHANDPATGDLHAEMVALGRAAQGAARALAKASTKAKNAALRAGAQSLRSEQANLLAANQRDLDDAGDLNAAMHDRLVLNDDRVEAMARGLEEVAELDDPIGAVIDSWERPNGLAISRVRVPLGVIGIIYESRPNVTADAGALCVKSGNAVILRGGSESTHSSRAIHACLAHGLTVAGLPEAAVQLVPTRDRAAVGELLRMSDYVDIIVPRGGRSLIERVREESRIPVISHLDGNCHVYVDRAAKLDMAVDIVHNAKLRRTGICGAAESLLIDRPAVATHLPAILDDLIAAGCEIRGDAETCGLDRRVSAASDEDWGTEYLDAIISVKIVEGVDEAIAHIDRHSSHHTESIVTEDAGAAEKFLGEIDSGIVLHNASTQYADGGEFGMGAEIGISTSKFHARGPVGVEQLTSLKYVVRGAGQVRP